MEDDISFATKLRIILEDFGIDEFRIESSEGGAITAIVEFEPDLVICDIMLNNHKSGLTIAELLATKRIGYIVVTQFKEEDIYDQIYPFYPLAYFTKPLDEFAFKYTISRVLKDRFITPKPGDIIHDLYAEYVFIRKGSRYEKVNFSEVLYVEAEGNYVTIHCQEAKYTVRSSLKKCLEHFSSDIFVQAHRNFMVNIHKIDAFESDSNTLQIQDFVISIGRSYKADLLKALPFFR